MELRILAADEDRWAYMVQTQWFELTRPSEPLRQIGATRSPGIARLNTAARAVL